MKAIDVIGFVMEAMRKIASVSATPDDSKGQCDLIATPDQQGSMRQAVCRYPDIWT